MNKNILYLIIFFLVGVIGFQFFTTKKTGTSQIIETATTATTTQRRASQAKSTGYTDVATFVFDDFHGLENIDKKFKFFYPTNWNNDGQYFSPEKIEYYNLYNVKAPIYFDLMRVEIFEQTEFFYQIKNSKRKSPDEEVVVDNEKFKKYDLLDYGSYGGDSAGRVIIYVGPKIKIDGYDYYLVFRWEEKPLTLQILKNDPRTFEQIVESIKFI